MLMEAIDCGQDLGCTVVGVSREHTNVGGTCVTLKYIESAMSVESDIHGHGFMFFFE